MVPNCAKRQKKNKWLFLGHWQDDLPFLSQNKKRRALFSCYLCFEIRPFALLPTINVHTHYANKKQSALHCKRMVIIIGTPINK